MKFDGKKLIIFIVPLLMTTSWAMAYEEVEDLVDIFSTDNAFIAVVDGRRNFSEDHRSREKLIWQGAKGEIGAFLTSDRLLAVSVRSGQWNTRYLKINEKKSVPEIMGDDCSLVSWRPFHHWMEEPLWTPPPALSSAPTPCSTRARKTAGTVSPSDDR